jgi:cytochrome c556
MKSAITAFAILALAATTAAAAPRLKPIMREWKAKAVVAELMLSGAAPYDEAAMRRILASFVADAQEIEGRVTSRDAAALDIKGRFSQFEADASAALQALPAKDGAAQRFKRLRGECGACHDVYAN